MNMIAPFSSLLLVLGTLQWQVAPVVAVRGEQSKTFGRARHLKATEPQAACEDALGEQTEEFLCECSDLSVNQTLLSCLDVTCTYCNADSSVCGSTMSEEVFGIIGDTDYLSESFMYSKGLNDTVTFALEDCETDEDNEETMCMGCAVTVNDVMCSSCVVQNCTSGPSVGQSVPSFDCSNVEAGAMYDLCDDDFAVPSGSVFEFLTPGSFDNCSLTTEAPTDAPSDSPTGSPSSIPSDMPSLMPSGSPTTSAPSSSVAPSSPPTDSPTGSPTVTSAPTGAPVVVTPMPTFEGAAPTSSAPSPDNAGTPTTSAPTPASSGVAVSTSAMAIGTIVASIVAAVIN